MIATFPRLPALCGAVLIGAFLAPPPSRAADLTTNALPVAPGEIVRKALHHSPLLKSRAAGVLVAAAQRRQADAQGRSLVDARFQALHFDGLENEATGPIVLPVIDDQYAGSVGLTHPLYTGGRVPSLRRSARLRVSAAEGERNAAAADTLLAATVAYWQWSKAVHLAEAMEAAVARSAAQADDTRHLREAGMATENDLLASEVLLDQVRLRRDDALRQIALARTEVERLTGETLPAGARPLGPACPPPPGLTPAGATALALTNRIEIAVLRKEMDAAEATARAARADRRPQVALVARYEQGRPNMRDFPPADKWSGDAYVGAAMSWNLLDGGATAGRLAEAQARVERIRWSLEDTRDHIAAQAQESLLSLQFAVARVQTAAHAETGARKNLDVATDLWKNGLARHSEMLDAQSRLTDAACQRIASAADAVMAEAHLRHATGLLTADDIHGSP